MQSGKQFVFLMLDVTSSRSRRLEASVKKPFGNKRKVTSFHLYLRFLIMQVGMSNLYCNLGNADAYYANS